MAMKPVDARLDQQVIERIRAEYLEMPGMKLTAGQMRRLCGIDETMCTAVLDSLVKANFLCLTSDGTYVRPTEGRSLRARPVKAPLTSTSLMTTRHASSESSHLEHSGRYS